MRIGEALIKSGLIDRRQLDVALEEQSRTNDRLGDIVLKTGFVTQEQMAPFLASYFKIDYVDLKSVYKDIKSEIIDCVPVELAKRFTLVPLDLNGNTLTVAMNDPLNILALDTLRLKTGYKIHCVISAQNDICDAIEYCYTIMPRLEKHVEDFIDLEKVEEEGSARQEDSVIFAADGQPVVQYVKSLIVEAVNARASDIHLKPKQNCAELRFRIDGILHERTPPPKAMIAAITTHIKILAELDIAEQRLPQDGRFKVRIGRSEIDVRTSSFPTIYGESVVMRLLNASQTLLGLDQLGFFHEDLLRYQDILRRSYGLILVTGPTGSGKTTTLYTSLNEIKSVDKNMLTIEDPVEYRLPFLQQSQVNSHIGFNFACGLRSILRQDPDVIMVGEIRDKETAEIAIHAALTGHLVFSTLHTNDAAGAAVRLINMGIEPFLITSSLLGVIGQRLIRVNCQNCLEEYTVDGEILKVLSMTQAPIKKFKRGKGCKQCGNTGYKGRTAIFELLTPNESIRRLILERRSSDDIRSAAQSSRMKILREIALEKVKEGLTTPEEVLRITQEVES